MSVQDKMEKTLREIHIMISRGQTYEGADNCVIVNKKDMLRQLTNLNLAVSEMMDVFEATRQSRDRGEREAAKNREAIVRNANSQAEDIYAASVIYTDDALGRIQDIIEEAGKSAGNLLEKLHKEMENEKRIVRSNQTELKCQLEDLKDTAKYLRIIEERNKENEKAKRDAKSKAAGGRGNIQRKESTQVERADIEVSNIEKEPADFSPDSIAEERQEPEFITVNTDVRIDEEYFKQAGLTPEGIPIEKPEVTYSKPEIKINEAYFKKAGISLEEEEKGTAEKPISPNVEELLKEDLDLEYFEWRDSSGNKKENKKKPEWKFPFRR